MTSAAPPPVSFNPARRVVNDLRLTWPLRSTLPEGYVRPSFRRTLSLVDDPLGAMLEARERFGPVFTITVLHLPVVFMISPPANHFMLVSGADNFGWRGGRLGDLIPLLGDGLLTTDGDYHRRARRAMLPLFHHERIQAAAQTILDETERAVDALEVGQRLDLYEWTRRLALRVAMRALFGFDPDRPGRDRVADEFEAALSFWGHHFHTQLLRGPGSPWWRMRRARRWLDRILYAEIARRRAVDHHGEDLLSLLLEAADEDGEGLSDREVRDQVMTLLFAGHDTTTSTVSFAAYELSRHPVELDRLVAERHERLGERPLEPGDLFGGLPWLEQVVDETLRLYPPAWVGPRLAVRDFEFDGHRIAAGTTVQYSSYASHRLAEVFPEPDAFRPQRFASEARAALPRGAYVPFGGGSRTCIGMRFGLAEVRAIVSALTARFRPVVEPGFRLEIRQAPTLSPAGGLPVRLEPVAQPSRSAAAAGVGA